MFYFKSSPFVIKKIKTTNAEVYLTFDDGPSCDLTEKILDLLKTENAKASFFVIGDRAVQNPEIIYRALAEGHAVLSHSIDHDYKKYFQGVIQLKEWLQISLQQLKNTFNLESNIFRPPAGVLTPPLVQAAAELNLRLVLWNHRFFDTRFTWTRTKADRSLARMKSGDIVLLHDFQNPRHHDQFLQTLGYFIREIHKKNFICAVLK